MTQSPANYIVLMLLSGMIMGTVFDIYNTVTSIANWLRFLRSILDIVFFAVSGVLVFRVSLMTDNGRFRLYTFGLLLIGYMIYRLLLHNVVVASSHTIVRLIGAVILGLWKIVVLFVIKPVVVILHMILVLLVFGYRLGCKIEDLACWIIALVSKIALFPFRGYKKIFANHTAKLKGFEEGIWLHLSNWLKRRPDRT
jgi:spore cortex biosynthesis protein YabQ